VWFEEEEVPGGRDMMEPANRGLNVVVNLGHST
jgi:hypothetical protein